MGESVTGNRSVPIHSVITVCTHPSQKAKKTLNDADIKAERILRQSMEKISRAFVCICRLQSLKNAMRIYFYTSLNGCTILACLHQVRRRQTSPLPLLKWFNIYIFSFSVAK